MGTMMTAMTRSRRDHFEPSDSDPQEQRRLRGHLEQIDYTAFVSNREVIPQVMGLGAWPWRRRPPAPAGSPRPCA
jgi:hypothetical protein